MNSGKEGSRHYITTPAKKKQQNLYITLLGTVVLFAFDVESFLIIIGDAALALAKGDL